MSLVGFLTFATFMDLHDLEHEDLVDFFAKVESPPVELCENGNVCWSFDWSRETIKVVHWSKYCSSDECHVLPDLEMTVDVKTGSFYINHSPSPKYFGKNTNYQDIADGIEKLEAFILSLLKQYKKQNKY